MEEFDELVEFVLIEQLIGSTVQHYYSAESHKNIYQLLLLVHLHLLHLLIHLYPTLDRTTARVP